MPAAEVDQATKVAGDIISCLTSLTSLSKNDSFDCLKRTFEENIQLRQEIGRLNVTNETMTKRYSAVANERDDVKKELEGKANTLHNKDKRNEELQRQCSDAKGQLEITSRELKAAKAQLEILGSFAIKMEHILPLPPLPKPYVCPFLPS
jgi:chromosome segregation ATPase